ncbi:hypothetical protein D779_2360 [Imhoffiella purpurea]|uniref:Uncharacterized protein n=1 Tax=Imhoffiella purpurea TaxID=1249627 RepID=W9V4U3_9GAMM|nr:hypothetical protein D779_2360 [Imhoffiella purpurea]
MTNPPFIAIHGDTRAGPESSGGELVQATRLIGKPPSAEV